MVHGKNRNPYRIHRRLNGLAGPEYHAIISVGLPIEPEDSQYGEYRLRIGHSAEAGLKSISEPFAVEGGDVRLVTHGYDHSSLRGIFRFVTNQKTVASLV